MYNTLFGITLQIDEEPQGLCKTSVIDDQTFRQDLGVTMAAADT